jgi:hypothetical protein
VSVATTGGVSIGIHGRLSVGLILVLIGLIPTGDAHAGAVQTFPSGMTVRVHDPQEISREWLVSSPGALFLRHPAVGTLELLTGPDDPRLRRADVERFWHCPQQDVLDLLGQTEGISAQIVVDVFILPTPPVEEQNSFARRNAILLAPGYGPVAPSTLAYILAHELGHVLTWAYLDPFPLRWRNYLQLRGLSGGTGGLDTPHADRTREILAEDIRFLFGGPLANVSGSIENHDLTPPDRVEGLERLLREYFDGPPFGRPEEAISRAYPNPCNPATTIEMLMEEPPGGASADWHLTVYDLRGRAVRSLKGRQAGGGRLAVRWDGTDQAGRTVPSGRYLYTVSWRGSLSRGAVLLVK